MDTQTQFDQLSAQAKTAGQSGDWAAARTYWVDALGLFPPESPEYLQVQTRIRNIDAQLEYARRERLESEPPRESEWKRRFYRLGPLGVFLWKFKLIFFFVITKGKVLLFGLTKLNTLFSMLVSLGLYASLYGWRFALGLIVSIYIHEMGHVVALRRYGIAATAPMFIPGFGAFIRLKAYPTDPGQDARVGLAGPVWGLAAAAAAWGFGSVTGYPIWFVIARTGAWINLFNLIPIWQLDGGRGFRALTRTHRGWILAVSLVLWALTEQSMLLFVSLGALYRMFSKDYAEQQDRPVVLQFAALLVLLSLILILS